jgi:hypothetical protein
VFEQSLRAQWSVFEWRPGAITGGVDERKVLHRAMIVRGATLNSPSRVNLILCRAIGSLGAQQLPRTIRSLFRERWRETSESTFGRGAP